MRREYQLHPQDLRRYTPRELRALLDDMTERERLAREGG